MEGRWVVCMKMFAFKIWLPSPPVLNITALISICIAPPPSPPPPPRWHSKHSADTRGPATATHHTYRYLCRYRAVPGYSQTGPHPRGPLLPPPPGNHGHREGGGGMASRGKSGCPDRAVHTPPLSVGRMSEGHLHHSHLHTYHPHCSHTHLHSHLHTHHLHHAHGCSIASGRRLSCSL